MKKKAVYGIVWKDNKSSVLLVQRRDLPVWVLPGGGLDEGETPEEGVQREVEEETGLHVCVQKQIAEYLPVNQLTQTTYLFECEVVGGSTHPTSESQAVSFFPLTHLPSRLSPPFALWIQEALLHQGPPLKKPIEGVTYRVLFTLLLRHPILIIRYLLTKLGIRFNVKH